MEKILLNISVADLAEIKGVMNRELLVEYLTIATRVFSSAAASSPLCT